MVPALRNADQSCIKSLTLRFQNDEISERFQEFRNAQFSLVSKIIVVILLIWIVLDEIRLAKYEIIILIVIQLVLCFFVFCRPNLNQALYPHVISLSCAVFFILYAVIVVPENFRTQKNKILTVSDTQHLDILQEAHLFGFQHFLILAMYLMLISDFVLRCVVWIISSEVLFISLYYDQHLHYLWSQLMMLVVVLVGYMLEWQYRLFFENYDKSNQIRRKLQDFFDVLPFSASIIAVNPDPEEGFNQNASQINNIKPELGQPEQAGLNKDNIKFCAPIPAGDTYLNAPEFQDLKPVFVNQHFLSTFQIKQQPAPAGQNYIDAEQISAECRHQINHVLSSIYHEICTNSMNKCGSDQFNNICINASNDQQSMSSLNQFKQKFISNSDFINQSILDIVRKKLVQNQHRIASFLAQGPCGAGPRPTANDAQAIPHSYQHQEQRTPTNSLPFTILQIYDDFIFEQNHSQDQIIMDQNHFTPNTTRTYFSIVISQCVWMGKKAVLLMFTDISPFREIKNGLKLEIQLDKIVSNMSSYLKIPLQSIISGMEMLRDDPQLKSLAVSKMVEQNLNSAQLLQSVILDLVDISCLRQNRLPILNIKQFNIMHCISDCIKIFQDVIRQKKINLQVMFQDNHSYLPNDYKLQKIQNDEVRLK